MLEHVHLLLSEPQRDMFGDRAVPLKPKGGLNGPPASGAKAQSHFGDSSGTTERGCGKTEASVRSA
jgi:hypothetical protein